MDKFLEDRKIEKNTYAIINYFKLLRLLEILEGYSYSFCDYQLFYDSFQLIGGKEFFDRLLLDCKEENIDIYSNKIEDLFKQLENNILLMKSVTFSKNVLVLDAIKNYELIKKFCFEHNSSIDMFDMNALHCLNTLAIPNDLVGELLKIKPIVKKIEER